MTRVAVKGAYEGSGSRGGTAFWGTQIKCLKDLHCGSCRLLCGGIPDCVCTATVLVVATLSRFDRVLLVACEFYGLDLKSYSIILYVLKSSVQCYSWTTIVEMRRSDAAGGGSAVISLFLAMSEGA